MMAPVLIMAGLLCWGLVLFNNKVLPEANHRTKVLMNDIQRTKPTFAIEPGKFTDDIGGYNLLIRKTFSESNKLEGVFIIDNSNPNESTILTAKYGEISFSKDYAKIIIDLHDGEIHQLSRQNVYENYRKVNFNEHIVSINAEGFGFSKSDENALSRGDRELSADSMRSLIDKIQSDYVKDKMNSITSAKALALDFPKVKFENEIKSDSSSNKQNELFIQTLLNRYRGLKSKFLSQKQIELSNHRQTDIYSRDIQEIFNSLRMCDICVNRCSAWSAHSQGGIWSSRRNEPWIFFIILVMPYRR
jgi:hypothetical protein